MPVFTERNGRIKYWHLLLLLVLVAVGIAIWGNSVKGRLVVIQSEACEAKELTKNEKKESVLPIGLTMTKMSLASFCGELSQNEVLRLRMVYVDLNGRQTLGSETVTGRGLLIGINPAIDSTEVGLQLHKSVTSKGTYINFELNPSGRRTMGVQRPLLVDETVLQHYCVFPQTLKLGVEVVVFVTSASPITPETMSVSLEHQEYPTPHMAIYAKYCPLLLTNNRGFEARKVKKLNRTERSLKTVEPREPREPMNPENQ